MLHEIPGLQSMKYTAVRIYGRLKSVSKTKFFLDLANVVATGWVIYITSRAAYARVANQPYQTNIGLLMLASIYLLIHKYLLGDLPATKRWARQDQMRKRE